MQQSRIKGLHDLTQQVGGDRPLGIVQEIEIWPYEKMVYVRPGISPGEWDI